MDEERKHYAVINASENPPFFQDLADALCEVRGAHRVDALQQARGRHYIFDTDLPEDQANAIRTVLAASGIQSIVVPMSLLTQLGPAVWITHADCNGDAFVVGRVSGKPLPVAWSSVTMIAYGKVIDKAARWWQDTPVSNNLRNILCMSTTGTSLAGGTWVGGVKTPES